MLPQHILLLLLCAYNIIFVGICIMKKKILCQNLFQRGKTPNTELRPKSISHPG